MEIKRLAIFDSEDILRSKSVSVDFEVDDINKYLLLLKEYCEKNAVYAMAIIQLGVSKRMIYIKNTSEDMSKNVLNGYNEDIVMINPIIKEEYGKTIFLEACESCIIYDENKKIYKAGNVLRPYGVVVEYQDINGNVIEEVFEGFKATVFYHEYDHLDGILHIDKCDQLFDMTLEEMKEFRNKNPYRVLSKK